MGDGPRFSSDRFDIVKRLGEGGMGVVYEARDRERGASIAIKTLKHLDPQALYRLKNEFRALQGIEHPNLVRLDELFEQHGEWFFTMELVRGQPLMSWIRPGAASAATAPTARGDTAATHRPLPARAALGASLDEARLRDALGQLASGLTAIHAAGKIHRDVKPSNVLVTRDGRVVLLDFGLVSDASGDRWSGDQVVGTMEYMAPEQALAARVGPAADWYGLGVILYEALTGALPHTGRTGVELLMNKQRYEPPPPRARVPGVPADLDALCVDLLRTDPAARPTGDEVLDRLGVADTRLPSLAGGTSSIFTQALPFVGRAVELDALLAAYRDAVAPARAAGPVIAVVEGESGIGKSELVRQALEVIQLDDDRAVVLSGRCYERESVPYKALDGVADALSRLLKSLPAADVAQLLPLDAALLGRLFPVLRRVHAVAEAPVRRSDAPDPPVMRARMFAALRELLVRLCEHRRVAVFIDDYQWADADSVALLRELLRPPRAPALLLVVTVRDAIADDAPARGALPGDVRRVEVGPLSIDGARELVERMAPALTRRDPAAATAIATESGGHPLFVLELVRHAEASTGAAGPTRLDEAVWSRVALLPGEARALLELLAVAGAPITHDVAAAALRRDYAEYERLAAALRVSFFAHTTGVRRTDHIEPYHNRVRESVLAKLDDARRRAHHERLAIALEQAGEPAEAPALVRHLEGAGLTERAAQHAREAAERAERALAFEQAAALYRDLLRLCATDDDDTRAVRIRLGHALAHAGRGAEAADAFLAAAEGADAATWLECRRLAAQHLLSAGYIDRGLRGLEEVAHAAGLALPATPRAALASLLWHRARLRLRGMRWKERHAREIADAELARFELCQAIGNGLVLVDTIRGVDFQTRSTLLALRLGERRRVALALAQEAIQRSIAVPGGRRGARALVERARRLDDAHSDPSVRGWIAAAAGIIDYFDGAFNDAAAYLTQAEQTFRDHTTGRSWELGSVRVFRMFCMIRRGLFRDLRALSEPYIRDAQQRGDRYVESSMRRSAAVLWLVHDVPDEGRRALDESPWTPPSEGFHLQHWYELEARGELALYCGEVEPGMPELERGMRRLRTSLLTRIQPVRTVAVWLHARYALAAMDEVGRRRELERVVRRAARQLGGEGVPYAIVPSLLLRAALARSDEAKIEGLRAAETAAGDNLPFYRAAAQRQRGVLMGGDVGAALVADADQWLRDQEVVNPERLVRIAVPGFTR